MNEGANKDTKLSKKERQSTSTSKEDSEVAQVKPCASINEADISREPTAQMNDANFPVQPTTTMKEADIFKPVYPNNITYTFAYLTTRINEMHISAEPTVQTNESDISVQPTVTLNVKNIFGQPTVLINKADLSPTEDSEECQEACRIFKWFETKMGRLKMLQGSEENKDYRLAPNEHRIVSINDKRTALEQMLKEIKKMTSTNVPGKAGSKEATKMLDMLQETTLVFLDNLTKSKSSCLSIKVLSTLIQHLSASIGSKVTCQDVQTFINGKRVLQLYCEAQSARESIYVKITTDKRYLEHDTRKAQFLKRKSQSHKMGVEWTISECTRTIDVRSANENLKALTKESEDLLLKYADLISDLMTKAKSFVTMKNYSERLLSWLMTKEIQDLYKE